LERFDQKIPVVAAIRAGQRHDNSLRSPILCNGHGQTQCKYGRNLIDFAQMANGSYQIHSEARGPHWIAWVSRDGSGKPHGSVVIVAETRELAETRARQWAEQSA